MVGAGCEDVGRHSLAVNVGQGSADQVDPIVAFTYRGSPRVKDATRLDASTWPGSARPWIPSVEVNLNRPRAAWTRFSSNAPIPRRAVGPLRRPPRVRCR